jgi:tetratricopeptide (TPR) repeat protein
MKRFFFFFMVPCLFVELVRADTVFLKSSDSARGVTVVAFDQGHLEALDSKKGTRYRFKYDDIACLRIDGEPDLNDGEKWLRLKDFDQAVQAYRKALGRIASKKSWLKTWSQIRLMNLLARQGRIDEATEIYIDLAERIPDWVITVAPTPKDFKADPQTLDRAGAKLVSARDETKSAKVREALAKFYQLLGCEKKLPAAKPVKPAGVDEKDFEKLDQPGPWLDAWAEEKITAGDPDPVLRVVDRLFKTSLRRNLPAIFYWRGRAQLAKQNFDDAGLNFLRAAIEFPASSYTPESLLRAGQSANQAGHFDYAKKIWQELIDNFSNSNDYRIIQLVEQARDYLYEKE